METSNRCLTSNLLSFKDGRFIIIQCYNLYVKRWNCFDRTLKVWSQWKLIFLIINYKWNSSNSYIYVVFQSGRIICLTYSSNHRMFFLHQQTSRVCILHTFAAIHCNLTSWEIWSLDSKPTNVQFVKFSYCIYYPFCRYVCVFVFKGRKLIPKYT